MNSAIWRRGKYWCLNNGFAGIYFDASEKEYLRVERVKWVLHPNLVSNWACLIFAKIIPLASVSMNKVRSRWRWRLLQPFSYWIFPYHLWGVSVPPPFPSPIWYQIYLGIPPMDVVVQPAMVLLLYYRTIVPKFDLIKSIKYKQINSWSTSFTNFIIKSFILHCPDQS